MMQRLGERLDEEEQYAVKEMDGIWLHMQDSSHKRMKKQEMKVFTMYEGWDKDQQRRSTLVGKTMLAGMETSRLFHEKREALIEKKYDVDEIQQRILNGDGGSWIKETYDPDARVQEIQGEQRVEALVLEDGRRLEVAGVFAAVGMEPVTGLLQGVAELDEYGYVAAGEQGITSAQGLFVAGDVRTKALRQVITAAADGANAATEAERYIRR